MSKKKFAQVGVGGRSIMFTNAIIKDFADSCELIAICDNNEGRLKYRADYVKDEAGITVKRYPAEKFDEMIKENGINSVVVTTKDCHHDEYICRAMELGCDVITEKPMTTDEKKCRAILDTQKKTGKECRVTFNYRYSPPRSQLKDLLMSGIIGKVLSVDFQWLLNTRHGADYFRRWHRNKENSGGLMVHKATHHFDLVNWWLSSVPETVYAVGKREFYTPQMAENYGFKKRAERCVECPESKKCPYYMDIRPMDIYRKCEKYDGYFRDRCVFSDKIDIEDIMYVNVQYRSGAVMNYSLNAFMPWEGFIINFNGTRGRIEHVCQETVYVSGDGSVPGELVPEGTKTRIFPHFLPPYEVDVWTGTGGHGGGDPILLNDIFGENPPADKYLRAADQRAGAWSIMTGVAANHSFKTGKPIVIKDLVGDVDEPDYPEMPKYETPVSPEDLKKAVKFQKILRERQIKAREEDEKKLKKEKKAKKAKKAKKDKKTKKAKKA